MKLEKYEEIEKHVPNIVNYSEEVEHIKAFFERKGINIEKVPIIFWNHIITLFERIEEGDQNEFDLTDVDELSKEAGGITKEFTSYMQKKHSFKLTEFETYLIKIHFEQIIKEEK